METTQGKAIAAFTTLSQMARKPMNSFAAFKLFKLKKALAPIVEFQSEQEQKIVGELGGIISETGTILIEDIEKRREFIRRQKELGDMECDIETGKIVMMPKELPELSLSDMEALEEFIEWKE